MPGGDKTGPEGKGEMTGRGLGPCGDGVPRGGRGVGRGRGTGWNRMWEKSLKDEIKEEIKQELKEEDKKD